MFQTILPDRFFPAHIVRWSTGNPLFDVEITGFDGNLMFERSKTNFYELYNEFEDSDITWLAELYEYLAHELDYLSDVESVYQPLN